MQVLKTLSELTRAELMRLFLVVVCIAMTLASIFAYALVLSLLSLVPLLTQATT
jgi:hypothetical protein